MLKKFNQIALLGNGEENPEEGMETDVIIEEAPKETTVAIDVNGDPIALPVEGDLNVDKVFEAEQLQEMQDFRDNVTQAVISVEALTFVKSFIADKVIANESLSAQLGKSVHNFLLSHKKQLGMPDAKNSFSMESFKSNDIDKVAATKVALEDFKSTIKQIWDAIVKAVVAAIAWLKKAFERFFINLKAIRQTTTDLTDTILKQRNSENFKKRKQGFNDLDKYVQMTTHYNLPSLKKLLTCEGEQPGNYLLDIFKDNGSHSSGKTTVTYEEAFETILDLVKSHSSYDKVFNTDFINEIKEIKKCIDEGTEIKSKVPVINCLELFSKNVHMSNDIVGLIPKEGNSLFVEEGYLGDFMVVNELNISTPRTTLDSLDIISNWSTEIYEKRISLSNNWLKMLTNEEITDGSKVIIEIESELMLYEKTIDKMENIQKQLEKILSAPIAEKKLDEENNDSLLIFAKAISSIITNINKPLMEFSVRGRNVCIAWNEYLKQMYLKEKELVNA
jgi:hypothetical protein